MNIRELKKALKAARIPAESYNLDGKGRDDERLCLVNENSKWVVYYLERGVRTTELFFDSEEEACDYILKIFVKEPWNLNVDVVSSYRIK